MPWQQFWIDPHTGATFQASYVRVLDSRARPAENRVDILAARFASVTTYSGGFDPLEKRDINVTGAQYAANFATQVNGAVASFNSMIAATSDSFVGNLPTMSGATPVP